MSADVRNPVTRRDALKAIGGAIATTTTATAVSAPVAASHADAKPNSVEITTDTEWLDRYRPILDLRHVPQDNRPTLLGWRATSTDPDQSLDVGVYAAEYAVQKDVISITSHAGDHEWIYVFVDTNTNEIDHVSYAAYHWLRGYVLEPPTTTEGGGVHPIFQVAPTYHNYVPLPEAPDSAVLLETESLGNPGTETGPLYTWLDNGMEPDLAEGAVHNPWLLAHDGALEAWWSREGSGWRNNLLVSAWATIGFGLGIGIRGSENADPGDAEL